jgi:hypothetical protein
MSVISFDLWNQINSLFARSRFCTKLSPDFDYFEASDVTFAAMMHNNKRHCIIASHIQCFVLTLVAFVAQKTISSGKNV